MISDSIGQEINKGNLVAYAVAPGDLRVGIVTGVSEKHDKGSRPLWWRELVQVTPLDQKKLHNKWYENHKSKFLVLDDKTMPFETVESYYKLEAQIEQWVEENNHIHERDKETGSE